MNLEISNIRESIVNRITVLTAIFLSLIYLITIIRIINIGWLDVYAIHLGLVIIVNLAAIFRHRINTNIKVAINAVVFLFISISGLFFYSLAGGYYTVIIAVAILSLLVSRKILICLMVLTALIFSAIAYAYISGSLTPIVPIEELTSTTSHWVAIIFSVFLLISIFVFAFSDVYQNLIRSLGDRLESEHKYSMLFENANDAIFFVKDGIIEDCNKKASDFFLCRKDELVGKNMQEISPELQPSGESTFSMAKRCFNECVNGIFNTYEVQHKRSNGELFFCSVSLSFVDIKGDTYIQAIVRDISEKKKQDEELKIYKEHLEILVKEKTDDLESANEELTSSNENLRTTLKELRETQAQLFHADKLASLGTLTAGVAHEINNPLNYIMGASFGLKKYFGKHGTADKDKTDSLIKSIDVGLDRVTNIVKGLNQFSRNNESIDEHCDIHAIIDNCLLMLNNKLKYNIEVDKKFSGKEISIIGNVGMLHQVFINLLSNSIYAIEDKGTIAVETKIEDNYAIIIIADSGCGIDNDKIPQVMNPFFTTKPPGEGTGLGLSISYKIIKRHNGSIVFSSEKDKGTVVHITLPLINHPHS